MGSQSEEPSKAEAMRERIEQSMGRIEERIGSKRGDDFRELHGRVRRRRAEERLREDDDGVRDADERRVGEPRAEPERTEKHRFRTDESE